MKPLKRGSVHVGGYAICWFAEEHPPISGSYVSQDGVSLYLELLAVKAAIEACPPTVPLDIVARSQQLTIFWNNNDYQGNTGKLAYEVRQIVQERPVSVRMFFRNQKWHTNLQKKTEKLAIEARKQREKQEALVKRSNVPSLPSLARQKASVTRQKAPVTRQKAPVTRQKVPVTRQKAPVNWSSKRESKKPMSKIVKETRQSVLVIKSKAMARIGQDGPPNPYTFAFGPGQMMPQHSMAYPQAYLPNYSFMPHHTAVPPSSRDCSKAGSSQTDVPIPKENVGSAHALKGEKAAVPSGPPEAQNASGVGMNNPVNSTARKIPIITAYSLAPVETTQASAQVMIEGIVERFKERDRKRKRPAEEGESEISKKFKTLALSDDDKEKLYDSQGGQKDGWLRWLGSKVTSFF